MASTAQYESELSSIEEFRSSRKERAKIDINSPSPSRLKLKKSKKADFIRSPPALKACTSIIPQQVYDKDASFLTSGSTFASSDSSCDMENNDKSKDTDYSGMSKLRG